MASRTIPPVFAAMIAIQFIPVIVTCVRLWHRKQRTQLWWDDFWAGMAMLATIWIIAQYLYMSLIPFEWFRQHPDASTTLIRIAYLIIPLAIWTARFSIIMSVVRILPKGLNRRISKASFVVFILMFVAVVVGKVTMCGVPVQKKLNCHYSRRANAIYLACNLASTFWLLTWPVYILFRMKLKRHERSPIVACFLGAVSLVALDIAHSVNLVQAEQRVGDGPPKNWKELTVTGNLQSIFALMCANALVLVMYIYRAVRKSNENRANTTNDDASDETETSSGNQEDSGGDSTGPDTSTSIISPLTTVYTGTFNSSVDPPTCADNHLGPTSASLATSTISTVEPEALESTTPSETAPSLIESVAPPAQTVISFAGKV